MRMEVDGGRWMEGGGWREVDGGRWFRAMGKGPPTYNGFKSMLTCNRQGEGDVEWRQGDFQVRSLDEEHIPQGHS